MINYRTYLDKLEGDALVILLPQPPIPLTGMASAIDLRMNSIISRTLVDTPHLDSPLLIPSRGQIRPKYVIVMTNLKNYKQDMNTALTDLKVNDLSILIPSQLKKEVKFTSSTNKRIFDTDIGEEKLISIKSI